jgi:peroxiredoxin
MTYNALRVFLLATVAANSFAAGSKKAFIEPAQPKWGDPIRLIYRSDLADAGLHNGNPAMALVAIWYPGRYEQRRVEMKLVNGHLEAEMTVPETAAYISANFVSRNAAGGPAYSMIYTRDGAPARDGWHQAMFHGSACPNQADCVSRELAAYPDNWTAYRDKWFVDRSAERADRIRADIAEIESKAAGRPVTALYALSYGRLMLGEEPAALAAIREMVERFPNEQLTLAAMGSYDYENYVHHFVGDGPKLVSQWKREYYRRNPLNQETREGLDSIGNETLPMDLLEAVCLPWIQTEPDNPKPYLALKRYERALDLLAAGQLRMYGDVSGKMSERLLAYTYINASQAAQTDGQFGKALAYAKASQTIGKAVEPAAVEAEASVWKAMGRTPAAAPAAKRVDAPVFHATALDGAEIDSAQLRGKIVVANFWFTGCGPCKAEVPDLNKLTHEFAGRNVVFLGFTTDDDQGLVRRFLKEYPFEYTIVPNSMKIAEKFGVESYPTHVVIGADGKIDSTLWGGGEGRAKQLRAMIERLAR